MEANDLPDFDAFNEQSGDSENSKVVVRIRPEPTGVKFDRVLEQGLAPDGSLALNVHKETQSSKEELISFAVDGIITQEHSDADVYSVLTKSQVHRAILEDLSALLLAHGE